MVIHDVRYAVFLAKFAGLFRVVGDQSRQRGMVHVFKAGQNSFLRDPAQTDDCIAKLSFFFLAPKIDIPASSTDAMVLGMRRSAGLR